MKPWIYISGPYSGDQAANVRIACEAFQYLARTYGHLCLPICPHWSHIQQLTMPTLTYDEWIVYDLDLIRTLAAAPGAIFRIPGESAGADKECKLATTLGIPVLRSYTALGEWVKGNQP